MTQHSHAHIPSKAAGGVRRDSESCFHIKVLTSWNCAVFLLSLRQAIKRIAG